MSIAVYCNSKNLEFRKNIEARFSESVKIRCIEEIENLKPEHNKVVMIVGSPGSDIFLTYSMIGKLWRFVESGGTLYGEAINCMSFPASRLFGFKQDYLSVRRTTEKLKVNKGLLKNIEAEGSLIEWGGYYQKGFSVTDNSWLTVGLFKETHKDDVSIGGETPALISQSLGSGKVIYAAFTYMGAKDIVPFRPVWLWKEIESILKEKGEIPLSSKDKKIIDISNRSIQEAIMAAGQWFLNSGILPDSNGEKGIFENIHSVTGEITKDFRPDCHAHAALMFSLYSEYTESKVWSKRSANIMNYLFAEGYQVTDEDSPAYGLWKWFKTPASYPNQIFTDDNSWVCFVLLYLYQKTGFSEYRKRGLMTAEALLATQHENGLRPEVLYGDKINEFGRKEASLREDVSMNPHFESIAHAAFIKAYQVTKDKKYLDVAYRGTKYLLENKSEMKFMYSQTSGYSRLLFSLVQLTYYYEDVDLKQALIEVINYLKMNQFKNGGIEEADNPNPNRFGKEDTGVYRFNGEGIADFLYTNNFLLINVWEAWKVTGDNEIYRFYQSLARFASEVQIDSSLPKYNGGWMRAYDLKHKEYFGNNGDTGWGPYCIEGGWTNAITTAGLLLGELDHSLFQSDNFIE